MESINVGGKKIFGRFIKHTNRMLFQADDGQWWFGKNLRVDLTGEPKHIIFKKGDMKVSKEPKIFLEDEAWYNTVSNDATPTQIIRKYGTKKNYEKRFKKFFI